MLLPSALPCDVRPPLPRSRFSSSRLFSTPPPSDDEVASQVNSGLYNTCRALQTLLGTQKPAAATSAKPEPLLSPIAMAPRMKVSKKSSKPKPKPKLASAPRGVNKRTRDVADDGRASVGGNEDGELKFSTPKRARLAPPELPLGIQRADFEGLESPKNEASLDQDMAEDQGWSAEDDRMLVELVLEKLKLTKDDWNECARKLGKDGGSLGKRWKELVGEGHVGLRRGRRVARMKIDSSWR